ncbi:MAG TPA: class III extradiol dioxygenase family protein [Stellaceae bacterium]|jgi:protocatechuate 4,5-dioxygenase beta chain|nr:class III extradiol dioxygenase family protein [Stellaceae bacterium]
MAQIVGGIGTSHIPSIGNAIAKGLERDPYWQPFFGGFERVRAWLATAKPDVAVVVYNDHGLNFFLDKMPTFAIGAAAEYRHADEGWGLPVARSFTGDPDLSWHLIESLVADEFDITSCQEMLVDHALTVPMSLLWPGGGAWPVRIIPVVVNTVQHPLPSPKRCFELGRAIGRALESYDPALRVLVVGTGGLSHQLEGKRAGFISKEFDRLCLDKLAADPAALTCYSAMDFVELAGSQGVEFMNWMVMRGALTGSVREIHRNYHIPISNTATGVMVLENRSAVSAAAAE